MRSIVLAVVLLFVAGFLMALFDPERTAGPCDGLTGSAMDACGERQQHINDENRDAGQWP